MEKQVGLNVPQLERMKELERELSRHKQKYAERAHDNFILKDVIEQKARRPAENKHSASNRQTYKLTGTFLSDSATNQNQTRIEKSGIS